MVSARLLAHAFNPLSLSAWLGGLTFVFGIQPSEPTWQTSNVASLVNTSFAACSLSPEFNDNGRGLTLRPNEWTELGLDCSFSMLMTDVMANYTGGETLTLSLYFDASASAAGIGFNQAGSTSFEVSRAQVQSAIAEVQAAEAASLAAGDTVSTYGPPVQPPGAASCGRFPAVMRLAQQASAEVLGVVSSLRLVWAESGLPGLESCLR